MHPHLPVAVVAVTVVAVMVVAVRVRVAARRHGSAFWALRRHSHLRPTPPGGAGSRAPSFHV